MTRSDDAVSRPDFLYGLDSTLGSVALTLLLADEALIRFFRFKPR